MSTDILPSSPINLGSQKAEGIQRIAGLLKDDYSFAPLSPVEKLIRNKKTGGLTSCERAESGRGIIDNKGFIQKTDLQRYQQAVMIYDALENVMARQLCEDLCTFIRDQYEMTEAMRRQDEEAQYVNFINSIHILMKNEKLQSHEIDLNHIEHCIVYSYLNKTYMIDAFSIEGLLKELHENIRAADEIFCYFSQQIKDLTDAIQFGQTVDGQILNWLFKYTYYCRKTIYSILILMGLEICWGHYFNNKEVIDGKISTIALYCNKYLSRIEHLNRVLSDRWIWLSNQINWNTYNNFYSQNLVDERNRIGQIPNLLNAHAYHIDGNLKNNLSRLYDRFCELNSKKSLVNLMKENFPELIDLAAKDDPGEKQ